MKRIVFLSLIPILAATGTAEAQGWRWQETGPRWHGERRPSAWYPPPYTTYRAPPPPRYEPYRWPDERTRPDRRSERQRAPLPKLMQGGARPNITPMPPERVTFQSRHPAGTIIIDTAGRQLLLTQDDGTALRYPISVGREGFAWTGEERISRMAAWPDWHPPAQMRQREPHLPERMTGGIRNPLGAKALYLGNTLYRIHGTNDPRTIGRASSSGCFRMLNGHVIDLADRVSVGTRVVVVSNLRAAGAQVVSSGR